MSTKKPEKPNREPPPKPRRPGPGEAERLVIPPEALEPGLDKILGKGAPPLDQRKPAPKPKGKK